MHFHRVLYLMNQLKHGGISFRTFLLIAGIVLCSTMWMTPSLALGLGFGFALLVGNTHLDLTHKIIKWLLQSSVVGLGFGMEITTALKTGWSGVTITFISILATLLLGTLLAWLWRMPVKMGFLISSGTAICGGSAIAAVAPAIQAEAEETSTALGVIFILNSVALFLFPQIGHLLHLTQDQFGYWAALAIHDTSSVVGAAQAYGQQALETATALKLTRALWIAPLAIAAAYHFGRDKTKVQFPYFIGLFLAASLTRSSVSLPMVIFDEFVSLAKTGLKVTLFLIGTSLSLAAIRKTGVQPMMQGILLWIVASVLSLWFVIRFI